MKTYIKLFSFVLLTITGLSACQNTLTEEEISKKAAEIHKSVLTIDTHNDTPFRFTNPEYNMAERHDAKEDGTKMDFPRMKEGGLDAAFFAVYVGQGPRDEEGNDRAYQKAMTVFNSIHETAEKHSDIVEIARSAEDAVKLEKTGKIAMFIGVENGYPVGTDIRKVEEFYNLGARYITLCHSQNNDICDSSTDRGGSEHGGLSEFGYQVVDEMNRLGMMIDVSHISDESFFDVIGHSKAPVIASHSSVRSVCNSPRNLNDDMLLALKENGGVIQICILSSYIKEPEPNPERDAAMNEWRERYMKLSETDTLERNQLREERWALMAKYPQKLATVKDAVDHIDYVVNLIGIEHVGIGTDFDGGGGLEDCFDVSEMGNITEELLRRGYQKKDIEKIWSGNIIRVMKAVEGKAAELKKLSV